MQIKTKLTKAKDFVKKSVLYVALASTLITGSACAPTRGLITESNFKREPTYLNSPDNIKGNEPRRITQKDTPYNLERVVINGHDLYVEKNHKKQEGETDFYFIRFQDHVKELDANWKRIDTTAETLYIPTKVYITDKVTNTVSLAKKITYTTEGQFAKRAEITKYNVENIETGIIKETQEDTRHKEGTQKIAGYEWHVPRVEKDKMSEKALPFYMMEVRDSKKYINANGEISLSSDFGFYRPVAVTRTSYDARGPSSPPSLLPSKTGETSSISP